MASLLPIPLPPFVMSSNTDPRALGLALLSSLLPHPPVNCFWPVDAEPGKTPHPVGTSSESQNTSPSEFSILITLYFLHSRVIVIKAVINKLGSTVCGIMTSFLNISQMLANVNTLE